MSEECESALQQEIDRWGFTNDEARLQAAVAWWEAARADGWTSTPLYPKFEAETAAAEITKLCFKGHVLMRRKDSGKWHFEAQIHLWGPDGLTIAAPNVYDWEKVIAGMLTCNACGATPVETHRYSFAGRCCAECLPEMRAKHERPGWTD